MSLQSYQTVTGMDFAGKKKKIFEDTTSSSINPHRYDKYSKRPETREPEETEFKKPQPTPPTVEKKNRLTPKRMFILFVILACLMIVWVWEATYVRQNLTEIEKLKDQALELEKTNEAIKSDIALLTTYQRIEKIAREQLRLIPPKEKPGVILIDTKQAEIIEEEKSKQ